MTESLSTWNDPVDTYNNIISHLAIIVNLPFWVYLRS